MDPGLIEEARGKESYPEGMQCGCSVALLLFVVVVVVVVPKFHDPNDLHPNHEKE